MPFPQHVTRLAPVGSLLKQSRPREARTKDLGRSPRQRDGGHLSAIRQLPCLKCGLEPCGEAAHVRMNCSALGKRQAIGAKPDDAWSVPLCPGCHTHDPDSQHRMGESVFWDLLGLNPLLIAKKLYELSPDLVRMRAAVFSFIAGRS